MVNMNRPGAIVLSRNGVSPYEFPSDVGDPFPDGATIHCVFSNTVGDVVADVDGLVWPSRAQFMFEHADVIDVKRAFNFEVFLVVEGKEYMQRYGKVIRREATFEYATQTKVAPVHLFDNFSGRAGQPGAMYAQVVNNCAIRDNAIFSAPNALATDLGLFYDTGAVRVQRAVNTDSVRMQVQVINGGQGLTRAGFCANSSLTSYLAAEFNGTNNHLNIVSGTGPLTGPVWAGPAGQAYGNSFFVLDYNDSTKTFAIFRAGEAEPAVEWVDDDNVVPHGRGYRYPFFSFNGSVLSTGPQIASWEIQDYVGAGTGGG